MPEPETPQQDLWSDLQPLLDRELSLLPEKYRLPIILCELEGKSIKGAAQHLGWPQGTLAGRLARARAMLAKTLARHGLPVSAGSLATMLAQNGASACVPTLVMSSTIKAGTLFAAGKAVTTGLISAKVAALTEGALKAMLLTKLKMIAAVVLVVACVGMPVGGLAFRTQTADESTVASEKARPNEETRAGRGAPDENKGSTVEAQQADTPFIIDRAKALATLKEKQLRVEYAINDEKAAKAAADEARSRAERDKAGYDTNRLSAAELSASLAASEKFFYDFLGKGLAVRLARHDLEQAKIAVYLQATQGQSEPTRGLIQFLHALGALREKQLKLEHALNDEKAAKAAADEAKSRAERDKAIYDKNGLSAAELSASLAASEKFFYDFLGKGIAVRLARLDLERGPPDFETDLGVRVFKVSAVLEDIDAKNRIISLSIPKRTLQGKIPGKGNDADLALDRDGIAANKPTKLVNLPVAKDAVLMSGKKELKFTDLKIGMRVVVQLGSSEHSQVLVRRIELPRDDGLQDIEVENKEKR